MGRKAIVNIGAQRFDKIIEENKFYIDKTGFIKEWWEYGADVTLITRPRRFGKTLNMSMVECFFSCKYAGRGDLFQGLSIWQEKSPEGDYKYRELQGTFPVIFLSFAPVKDGKTKELKKTIKMIFSDVYGRYKDIMESEIFDDNDRKAFFHVNDSMDDATASTAINRLCGYLARYYGKEVIVILDEYDTPMQEAWLAGAWEEAVTFFRNFLNHTFKTNPYLYRGLITGITRISKESIFSDLNNMKVATTTSNRYAACFGFTEEEVFQVLDDMGFGGEKQEVKRWYDGFSFGKYTDIYNPWSIASLIDNDCEYDTYWAATSSNSLVNTLVQRGDSDIKQTMEGLLQGKSFTAEIDEQIIFERLGNHANAVWSLLLATGYLKVEKLERVGARKRKVYTLALTNMEVESMFEDMVRDWFGGNVKASYNNFIKALLLNDVEAMNEYMNKVALHSFSSFDIAAGVSDDDAPERFYHGFVLGLMVELAGRFQIKSNRESGFGRYDVMLLPADRKRDFAYIIEFKVHKPRRERDLQETVANAHAQMEEKRYQEELMADGFAPEQIRKYGFAFQEKNCLIG